MEAQTELWMRTQVIGDMLNTSEKILLIKFLILLLNLIRWYTFL